MLLELPCRYSSTTLTRYEVVGGGKPMLLATGGVAAAVIVNEVAHTFLGGQ
jgi:hypothetical protein